MGTILSANGHARMTTFPSTNRTRAILTGLVAVHVGLHVVALSMIYNGVRPGGPYDFIAFPFYMLGSSQGALVAIWAMLGRGKFLWRVLPTVLGAIVYLWLFQPADPDWIPLTFGELCVVGLLLAVARVAGLKIVKASTIPRAVGPTQFTIRDLLIWTTALAVVLSVLRCLPANWYLALSRPLPGAIVVFGCLTLVPLVALYCALGGRWLPVRLAAVPLAVYLGGYLLAAARIGPSSTGYFAMLLGLMAAWLLVSLWVVRLAGYRLAWRRRLQRVPS